MKLLDDLLLLSYAALTLLHLLNSSDGILDLHLLLDLLSSLALPLLGPLGEPSGPLTGDKVIPENHQLFVDNFESLKNIFEGLIPRVCPAIKLRNYSKQNISALEIVVINENSREHNINKH